MSSRQLLRHQADCHSWIEEERVGERKRVKSVLHAAIYGEGRGGTQEILELLQQQGLRLTEKTSEGYHGLHIAFQTGNIETIRFCQQETQWEDDPRVGSPLDMGIKYGRMTQDQLVKAAPPTAASLKSFIHHASECPWASF